MNKVEKKQPFVECRGICKSFTTDAENLTVLKNLDLVLYPETTNVILGESGCGKSTFLNILGGLESLSAGTVQAGPYKVHELDETESAEYRKFFIGFVFQFHYLLKDFTALENVMIPALIAGMKRKEALERAKMLLAEVNLEKRMKHFPPQLSGGERQRVAVARALVNNPRLVLADEPTGNLDPANASVVRDFLFSAVTKNGSSLLMVTHDRSTAPLADYVYVLENGAIKEWEGC